MPSYDPLRHHRHSIRLKGYNYAQLGTYFVTLCTYARVCSLGKVAAGQMQLNDWGQVAAECWAALPSHFGQVGLGEWVVMPNHMHSILMIMDCPAPVNGVGASIGVPIGVQHCCTPTNAHPHVSPGSLGAILRSFKSAVTKRINLLRGTHTPPVWQRNYYERIIRDERGLNAIGQYIRRNPAQWSRDRDNAANGQPAALTAAEYVCEAEA